MPRRTPRKRSGRKAKRAYDKRYYLRRRTLLLGRWRVRTQKARRLVRSYLRKNPCRDCDNKDIRVLDFDHVRGTKRASVSDLVRRGSDWKIVAAEIAKCDVRCSNCHRVRHWKERNEIRTRQKKVLANPTEPD